MLLSAVSVLVVAHSSSEIPEGLMNSPVLLADERDHLDIFPKSATVMSVNLVATYINALCMSDDVCSESNIFIGVFLVFTGETETHE